MGIPGPGRVETSAFFMVVNILLTYKTGLLIVQPSISNVLLKYYSEVKNEN